MCIGVGGGGNSGIIAEHDSIPLMQNTEKWRLRDGIELNGILHSFCCDLSPFNAGILDLYSPFHINIFR